MWHRGLVAPWHVGSSQIRARTHDPCIGRRILNHCTTREAPHCLHHSPLFQPASLLSPEVAKLFSDLGPESWIQIQRHDLLQVSSSPWTSVPFVSGVHPLQPRGGGCCRESVRYHSCSGGCWQVIVSLFSVCVHGDPARRSSSGSDSFAQEEGEVRNPQTQTSLGWKPFTANAYRNILVFYKPLVPSTRARRLIRPEGPAAVLLIARWICIPLAQLLSV